MPPIGRILDTDTDFIGEAVKLHRRIKGRRKVAQSYVFIWLLLLAEIENTMPADVLDKLVRSQPSRADQAKLMRQLRAALREPTDDA